MMETNGRLASKAPMRSLRFTISETMTMTAALRRYLRMSLVVMGVDEVV